MADFLTAVSTKKTASKPVIEEVQTLSIQDAVTVDSAKTALNALKSQPSHETVTNVLKFLSGPSVSLTIPEPVYASIAHELVNNTVPNYWGVFKRRVQDPNDVASILRNPTGIGHLLTRLRSLIAESRQKKAPGTVHNVSDLIQDTLDILGRVLSTEDVTLSVWKEIQIFGKNDIQKKLMWKEFLAQVASGRVLSVRAEAEDVLKAGGAVRSSSTGNDFADWLGRNFVHMATAGDDGKTNIAALTELSSKILSLGYTGRLLHDYPIMHSDHHNRSLHRYCTQHSYREGSSDSHRRHCEQTQSIRATEIFQFCHHVHHKPIFSVGDHQ